MSKTARPARATTARKRTTAASKATKTPRTAAKRTKSAAAKKATSSRAGTTAGTAPAKRAARPRLPADVSLAVKAAGSKQAADVTVLDLRNATAFTDFFVICTGANVRQVQAIADAVEAGLKAKGQSPALVEGYRRGEWVLLDYFDFIVHIFLPVQREFYALERLWGGAESIDVSPR